MGRCFFVRIDGFAFSFFSNESREPAHLQRAAGSGLLWPDLAQDQSAQAMVRCSECPPIRPKAGLPPDFTGKQLPPEPDCSFAIIALLRPSPPPGQVHLRRRKQALNRLREVIFAGDSQDDLRHSGGIAARELKKDH
jgi:hypothetical protein